MRSTKSVAHSTTDPTEFPTEDMALRQWLEENVTRYNQRSFIVDDPICVPHQYHILQDIEIAGFFTAIMAWGQRKTIISKANTLMQLMDSSPYDFIRNHKEKDRQRFITFKHRTFQPDDVIYLIDVLQRFYSANDSLERAFMTNMSPDSRDVYEGLAGFHNILFDQPWVLERTRKHIATPERKSSCKRLNMFLRWMVRSDENGVDFGLWKSISPAQLIIPLDVHVGNVARRLKLLDRKANDWIAARLLTERLRQFDAADPVKYDFALFGAGVSQGGH